MGDGDGDGDGDGAGIRTCQWQSLPSSPTLTTVSGEAFEDLIEVMAALCALIVCWWIRSVELKQ